MEEDEVVEEDEVFKEENQSMEKTPLVKKPPRFAGYQSPTPGHHTRDKKARRHALTMSNVRPVQIPCWLVRTEGQLQLGRGEPPLLWPRGL